MRTLEERRDEQRKNFDKHVVTYHSFSEGNAAVEMIKFGEPGTSNYYIEFLFTNGTLFVRGDLGDAVYCWHYSMTLKALGNVQMDYMAGKCQASPNGRKFEEWNKEEAKETIFNMLEEYADEEMIFNRLIDQGVPCEEGIGFHPTQMKAGKQQWATEQTAKIIDGCDMDTKFEWELHLAQMDDPEKLFHDEDWWDWAYGAGDVPATRLIIQHLALTLAIKQLTEKGVL